MPKHPDEMTPEQIRKNADHRVPHAPTRGDDGADAKRRAGIAAAVRS
jgi:hypothetical protein